VKAEVDTKHHEWREGSDPFNARQPGEVAKVPKSAWRTGTMRRFGNEGLTSSIPLSHRPACWPLAGSKPIQIGARELGYFSSSFLAFHGRHV